MTAYYNEFDKGAAAWLRVLISEGLIAKGYVDERSITEVTPGDVAGFTQCHWFAGIGGWSYALRLAGVSDNTPCWTGSPPCQPFSVAGKQLGQLDERHLAPAFMRLVDQCRPTVIFGEQVAAAIGKHWLDDLFAELERQGYSCGAAVLPACSVGAPHKRDRLFFGAQLADADGQQRDGGGNIWPGRGAELTDCGGGSSMADADNAGSQGWCGVPERADQQFAGAGSVGRGLADAGYGTGQPEESRAVERGLPPRPEPDETLWPDPYNGFWASADWIGCRDGKFRPVKSGTFPLANGVPARVGRLRGYGNAIVPQVAAEFIKAFIGSISDATSAGQTKN